MVIAWASALWVVAIIGFGVLSTSNRKPPLRNLNPLFDYAMPGPIAKMLPCRKLQPLNNWLPLTRKMQEQFFQRSEILAPVAEHPFPFECSDIPLPDQFSR
jgi:hypothetical protein